MYQSLAVVLGAAGLAAAQLATTSEPALSQIQAAQATTVPLAPKSSVKGVAFQQFYQVWLENTVSCPPYLNGDLLEQLFADD